MRLRPDNSIWENFKNKKIMILVPHQDDEIFLCGTILGSLRQVTNDIYIVFTTNGDYGNEFSVRRKQCIRALSVYGILKNNIFFLGYGDQYSTEYGHMYHAPEDAKIISRAGFDHTYGDDLCMKRSNCHHEYTLHNFKKDLDDIIRYLSPDVFFCNDLDWHPEHRFTSLMFDKVIGELLKRDSTYRPEIYKGFIYFLGWDGKLDYRRHNLDKTKKPHRYLIGDKRFEFGNPYFLWKDRLSFPIDSTLVMRKKNRLYLAIQKYAFSKNARKFYYSMMNSDAVFWKRETNNIMLDATIKASSGQADYLNDFVIADSSDILLKNMPFDKSVWYPSIDDHRPKIEIEFKRASKANEFVLYRDVNSYANDECKLDISVMGVKDGETHRFVIEHTVKKYDIKSVVKFEENLEITGIVITMNSNNIGFSEIEVLRKDGPTFIKIQIGGIYAYNYYVKEDDRELPISIEKYGAGFEEVFKEVIHVKPNKESVLWDNNKLVLGKNFKSCYLRATSNIYSNVFDLVKVVKGGK